jgi:hypothetical protein
MTVHTLDDIVGAHEAPAADFVGLLKHGLCALMGIGLGHRRHGCGLGDLVEQDRVALRVLQRRKREVGAVIKVKPYEFVYSE